MEGDFQVGRLLVQPKLNRISDNSKAVHIEPKTMQVLVYLVEHAGDVMPKERIIHAVWADTFVTDDVLTHAISELRRALGDDPHQPRFIQTIPKGGYRLIAPVETFALVSASSVAPGASPEAFAAACHHRAVMKPPFQRHWVLGLALVALASVVAGLVGLKVAGLGDRLLDQAAAPRIESLAVLPLSNLSGDPQQEYFADGMTEELITTLGKVSALRVISRTSVMQYKQTKKALPAIARELNVDAVVEGSVLRSGNRVRITAQLVDAKTEKHLWAESYERDLRDILALQNEVAQAITNEIKIKLTPEERARMAHSRPVNPEAHELYLKGRYEWDKRTEERLKRSLAYFERAVAIDPDYALAYSGVADFYIVAATNALIRGTEAYPKAKAAAVRAIALDPGLAEGHASLASVLWYYDRDHAMALREYERAIDLNPNYATAHHWYALSLAFMGRSQEAIREIEQARRLDPLSPRINANVGFLYYFARQYDQAIIEERKAVELEPDSASAHAHLGQAYLQKGRPQEALEEFRELVRFGRTDSGDLALVASAYAAMGNRREALQILKELKQDSKRRYVSPISFVWAYVSLGQKEEALAYLQKAFDDNAGGIDFIKVDPVLDPLRPDPRFQDLLRRMNFPP